MNTSIVSARLSVEIKHHVLQLGTQTHKVCREEGKQLAVITAGASSNLPRVLAVQSAVGAEAPSAPASGGFLQGVPSLAADRIVSLPLGTAAALANAKLPQEVWLTPSGSWRRIPAVA